MSINQLFMKVGLDALLAIFPFTGSLGQILKDTATFKAYDFRGKDPDASMEYALKNIGPGMPVIVDVQSKSDTLVKATGKIMKEMDQKGYKNMVLLASEPNTKGDALLECVLFYGNGSFYGMLVNGLTDDGKKIWLYYNQSRTLILQKYPKDFALRAFIRQKISEAYKAGGGAISKD
jgi:hypothetical protein